MGYEEDIFADNKSRRLLSRDEFRTEVFKRDGHTCVFCTNPAKDAHHIMERRLWPDGGYYLDNGASVCWDHHLKCETTEITPEEVRNACKIIQVCLPPTSTKTKIMTSGETQSCPMANA